MALTEILFVLLSLLSALYIWCKYNQTHWKRRGIPYIRPTFLIGNTKEAFKLETSFGLHISDVYNDPAMKNESVVGIYALHKPALVLRDPELIKLVLIKEFNKFSNRYARCDPHGDKLGFYNLFFLTNPLWRDLRQKLTPVFTSGKVKQMYPLMLEIANDLEQHLQRSLKHKSSYTSEIKEVCACFTTDMIATIAFGVRANSLENPNAEFRKQGRMVFNFTLFRGIEIFITFFLPKMVTLLRAKFFTKEFSNFLRETIRYVMKERETSGTLRNDLIDILVNLKREAALDKQHYANNFDFLVAQTGAFFTAGFETSSSTMTFALYELSKQPALQERLRTEINEALIAENGKLSYETIQSLEYLSMVVDEVLRLYPVLPFLDREYARQAGEDFEFKNYNYKLEHGTPIFIPAFALQRDPKYWPNPNHFDPERFSPESKKYIDPMVYMPFGVGPHNCIGSRIGLLQAKIGLVHFFKNHYVRRCEKTIDEIKFDPKSFLLLSEEPIYMDIINDRLYDDKVAVQ